MWILQQAQMQLRKCKPIPVTRHLNYRSAGIICKTRRCNFKHCSNACWLSQLEEQQRTSGRRTRTGCRVIVRTHSLLLNKIKNTYNRKNQRRVPLLCVFVSVLPARQLHLAIVPWSGGHALIFIFIGRRVESGADLCFFWQLWYAES